MSVSSSGWGRALEKGGGRLASVRSSRFPGVRQSRPRGWGQALHRRSNPILTSRQAATQHRAWGCSAVVPYGHCAALGGGEGASLYPRAHAPHLPEGPPGTCPGSCGRKRSPRPQGQPPHCVGEDTEAQRRTRQLGGLAAARPPSPGSRLFPRYLRT